jgi:hypothetical protein
VVTVVKREEALNGGGICRFTKAVKEFFQSYFEKLFRFGSAQIARASLKPMDQLIARRCCANCSFILFRHLVFLTGVEP